jgi:ssDNA-binding Zn-finger/Zn-ribbon topoisomerase 1
MVLRTAKSGRNAGAQFWGCSGYPDCRGACPLDGNA